MMILVPVELIQHAKMFQATSIDDASEGVLFETRNDRNPAIHQTEESTNQNSTALPLASMFC
jgi:hypothetical protein